MGSGPSKLEDVEPQLDNLCLCFVNLDTIVALHGDANTWNRILKCLEKWAPAGLESAMNHGSWVQFKLKGEPFWDEKNERKSVAIQQMFFHLLMELFTNGWKLVTASPLSTEEQVSTMFLQRTVKEGKEVDVHDLVAISRNRTNKLYFYGGTENMNKLLSELLEGISEDCTSFDRHGMIEFTMKGAPWVDKVNVEESIFARRILIEVIKLMHSNGYHFCGNLMACGRGDNLYFEQAKNALPSDENCHFFILSLNSTDTVRMIDAEESAVDVVSDCITTYWSQGIQHCKRIDQDRVVEFQLSDKPWFCFQEETPKTSMLLLQLLKSLLANGWEVYCTLDVSHRHTENAVFVMRSCEPKDWPHMCIAPYSVDGIKIVNAPDHIVKTIGQAASRNWMKGNVKHKQKQDSYEIELDGEPWVNSVLAKHLMLTILVKLRNLGWKMAASADSKVATRDGWTANNWFLYLPDQEEIEARKISERHINIHGVKLS